MPNPKTTGSRAADASPGNARSKDDQPDALALLATDHKDIRKLFRTYKKLVENRADGDERFETAQRICEMLTIHAEIEEQIFYPAMRESIEADSLLDEAEVEHASVKDLVAQIEAMDPDEDLYDAKVTVLGEYVDHHVNEEENEIFPKARSARIDLAELGVQLRQRKDELSLEEVPAF